MLRRDTTIERGVTYSKIQIVRSPICMALSYYIFQNPIRIALSRYGGMLLKEGMLQSITLRRDAIIGRDASQRDAIIGREASK